MLFQGMAVGFKGKVMLNFSRVVDLLWGGEKWNASICHFLWLEYCCCQWMGGSGLGQKVLFGAVRYGFWYQVSPTLFASKTSGIPNHVVWTTNGGHTKPHAHILAPGELNVPNHMPTLNQSTIISFHKKTPRYLIWINPATPLNSYVLSQNSSLLQLYQQRHTTCTENLIINLQNGMWLFSYISYVFYISHNLAHTHS